MAIHNKDPEAKLALRRHFLDKYHADQPPRVFDCCQGNALLWTQLRKEYDVASYWGVDLEPKKGRLKINSIRVLNQPGWAYDVIDVDTFGSPWDHYDAILRNLKRPATVFLTIGREGGGRILHSNAFGGKYLKLPARTPDLLKVRVAIESVDKLIWRCTEFGLHPEEACMAVSDASAGYYGVRLVPSVASQAG
jgi:hypothetical protein